MHTIGESRGQNFAGKQEIKKIVPLQATGWFKNYTFTGKCIKRSKEYFELRHNMSLLSPMNDQWSLWGTCWGRGWCRGGRCEQGHHTVFVLCPVSTDSWDTSNICQQAWNNILHISLHKYYSFIGFIPKSAISKLMQSCETARIGIQRLKDLFIVSFHHTKNIIGKTVVLLSSKKISTQF